MTTIEQAIDIEVPAAVAYARITRFEDYPEFIAGLETVRQYDDTHLHWVARIDQRPLEWEVEIMQQEKDRCIAWYDLSGARIGGRIDIDEPAPGRSRLTIRLDSLADPAAGLPAAASRRLQNGIAGALAQLKEYIETHASADGGWRGEIRDGRVLSDDGAAAREAR
jgi:uncharacterized membrane protein